MKGEFFVSLLLCSNHSDVFRIFRLMMINLINIALCYVSCFCRLKVSVSAILVLYLLCIRSIPKHTILHSPPRTMAPAQMCQSEHVKLDLKRVCAGVAVVQISG